MVGTPRPIILYHKPTVRRRWWITGFAAGRPPGSGERRWVLRPSRSAQLQQCRVHRHQPTGDAFRTQDLPDKSSQRTCDPHSPCPRSPLQDPEGRLHRLALPVPGAARRAVGLCMECSPPHKVWWRQKREARAIMYKIRKIESRMDKMCPLIRPSLPLQNYTLTWRRLYLAPRQKEFFPSTPPI